jgi:hypothetical protein
MFALFMQRETSLLVNHVLGEPCTNGMCRAWPNLACLPKHKAVLAVVTLQLIRLHQCMCVALAVVLYLGAGA